MARFVGELPNALSPSATATVAGQLAFSWTDNTCVGNAAANDRSILVAHCPARQQTVYTTIGADRSAGAGVLTVSSFSGQVVETYIGFLSARGKDVASSIFTGQLTVL